MLRKPPILGGFSILAINRSKSQYYLYFWRQKNQEERFELIATSFAY